MGMKGDRGKTGMPGFPGVHGMPGIVEMYPTKHFDFRASTFMVLYLHQFSAVVLKLLFLPLGTNLL